MTQAFRDHEMRLMNPPYRELVDERCDGSTEPDWPNGSGHDLNEHVYSVSGDLLCSGCLRALLVKHFQDAMPNDLDEYPFEAVAAERCDACGMYRCACEDAR